VPEFPSRTRTKRRTHSAAAFTKKPSQGPGVLPAGVRTGNLTLTTGQKWAFVSKPLAPPVYPSFPSCRQGILDFFPFPGAASEIGSPAYLRTILPGVEARLIRSKSPEGTRVQDTPTGRVDHIYNRGYWERVRPGLRRPRSGSGGQAQARRVPLVVADRPKGSAGFWFRWGVPGPAPEALSEGERSKVGRLPEGASGREVLSGIPAPITTRLSAKIP